MHDFSDFNKHTYFFKFKSTRLYLNLNMATHLDRARTHHENRDVICLVCGEKGAEKLNDALILLIKQFVLSDYDVNDERFPHALCGTHKTVLYEYKSGNFKRKLNMQSFTKYSGYITRQTCISGNCMICNTAQAKSHKKPLRGRPSGQASMHSEESIAPTPKKLCSKCLSFIGRGLPHDCSKSNLISNAMLLMPPSAQEKLCSSVLRDRNCASDRDGVISLSSSAGRPMTVKVGFKENEKSKTLNTQNFCDLQMDSNLSGRQTKAVATMIRKKLGRPSIESNLQDKLSDMGKSLSSFFVLKEVQFFVKSDKELVPENRPMVVVQNTKEFIEYILETRGLNASSVLCRLGIDGGQGFFKLCLNIIDTSNSTSSGKFLDSGIKHLFILCIVPDLSELYVNIKICIQELELTEIDFALTTDLKVANILAGLQSHERPLTHVVFVKLPPAFGKIQLIVH